MKRTLKIVTALLVLGLLLTWQRPARAQQDPMYTQYMDNLLVINPGYAGSLDIGKFLLVSRNQWVSFPNAPKTSSVSYHTALPNNDVGLGLSIMNDKIGPQRQIGIYADYSYKVQVAENYKLGMGLKGGVSFYRAALTELNPLEPDPIFSNDIYKNFLPSFGVGFYLYSDVTYFGLSVPNLIRNTISRDDYLTDYVQKEEIHLYFIAGHQFDLSSDFQLKANTLFRYVPIAPPTLDVTALFGFRERFWAGPMFRLGDAFGFLAQFNATDRILIGYSYDLTYSELNAFNNGTHEIMFSYSFDLFE